MLEITLDGPGKNALGTTMMRFLLDRLKGAGGEPVLLTGTGDAFSAGLDLREVASLDAAGIKSFLGLLEEMTSALYAYPGPLVALVNGHAIAGGCVVAMTCDFRVAAPGGKTKIGLNEVALGLRYPPRILELARKRLDLRSIGEVVLGAGLHGPEEALRLGLLDAVSDDPRAVATQKLAALAAHPRAAYAAAKREIRGTLDVSAEVDRKFAEEGLPTWTSDELKARLAKALAR